MLDNLKLLRQDILKPQKGNNVIKLYLSKPQHLTRYCRPCSEN